MKCRAGGRRLLLMTVALATLIPGTLSLSSVELFLVRLARIQRIMLSDLVQKAANASGVFLPSEPVFDFDACRSDIERCLRDQAGPGGGGGDGDDQQEQQILAQLAKHGCLPQQLDLPDSAETAFNTCHQKVLNGIMRNPFCRGCPRRNGRRRRRGLFSGIRRRVVLNAVPRYASSMMSCVSKALGIVSSEGDPLVYIIHALIDEAGAPEDFKEQKRWEADQCVQSTPEDYSSVERVEFLSTCLLESAVLSCALGAAERRSPLLLAAVISRESGCMSELQPSRRTLLSNTFCSASSVEGLMEERLQAGQRNRRRRRQLDILERMSRTGGAPNAEGVLLQSLGGLEGVEELLGTLPQQCRGRRCSRRDSTTPAPLANVSQEKLEAVRARAEAVVGPPGQLLESLPARLERTALCVYISLDALLPDGSVDLQRVREEQQLFSGPQWLKQALLDATDRCQQLDKTGSALEFHQCLGTQVSYRCRISDLLQYVQRKFYPWRLNNRAG